MPEISYVHNAECVALEAIWAAFVAKELVTFHNSSRSEWKGLWNRQKPSIFPP